MSCYDAKIHPKAKVEPSWSNTSVFLGNDQQIFAEPLGAHGNSGKECVGLLRDFKKKMQQTELHSPYLTKVEVPVYSFLLNITDTINPGTEMHQHDQKRKTLPQDYRSHLCVPSPSNRRRLMATHR